MVEIANYVVVLEQMTRKNRSIMQKNSKLHRCLNNYKTVAESMLPGSSQILNPTLFFSEIPDPMNTLPDPWEGGTWVRFCWVCAVGLSESPPHYSLFYDQLQTPS